MNRREQLAWLAGLIDGEGCISLTRRSPQRKHRCVSPSYRLILKVSMCHLATVRRCREITGLGSLHMQDVQKKHYSSAYTWFCNATDADIERTPESAEPPPRYPPPDVSRATRKAPASAPGLFSFPVLTNLVTTHLVLTQKETPEC